MTDCSKKMNVISDHRDTKVENPKQGTGRIKYMSTVRLIGKVGSDQTSNLPSDLYKC